MGGGLGKLSGAPLTVTWARKCVVVDVLILPYFCSSFD